MTCVAESPTSVVRHPETVELELLGERIAEGAGHLAAATGAWLALIEEFDRRSGWAEWGVKSCAQWLSWRCGIGIVAAREHVRVARTLVELPLTRAELAAGRLSYSKVRALTRVATPTSEVDLVPIALASTGAQLDQLVAGLRKAGSLDDVNARHEARSVSWSWAEDGSLILRGRFSPEEGAVVIAALEAAHQALQPEENASAEAPEPEEGASPKRNQRQEYADAMVALAETTLASGLAAAPGGARHQVNIHTDLDALLDRDAARRSPARIEDGPELHPETVDRLCCDSGAVIVAHHEKNSQRPPPRDVDGRRTTDPGGVRGDAPRPGPARSRLPLPGLHREALRRRPPRHLLVPRRSDRPVESDPALPTTPPLRPRRRLPRRHRPQGRIRLPPARRPADPRSTVSSKRTRRRTAEASTPSPSPRATATPNWNGDRLDLDYAVAVLTQEPRHASAEASIPAPPAASLTRRSTESATRLLIALLVAPQSASTFRARTGSSITEDSEPTTGEHRVRCPWQVGEGGVNVHRRI